MSGQSDEKTILIVDDDDLASVMTHLLESRGYRVRRASDGEEGVRMAREQPPDLILLDFMMPVKDGFDACREIRSSPEAGGVPIVALTAFGQDIGEIHGLTRGGDAAAIQDFLEKPVEPNVFLERIALALGKVPS